MIGENERRAVMEVLDGPMLVHGPRSKVFEREFAAWTGAPRAVSLSSCTAGLHLVWFDQGIGPGDEVLVAAQTHVATAHAVEYTGARPVFVDVDPASGNMDPDAAAAAITPRTRGISPVHYLGVPADMEALMRLADRHGLFVLEDCALAVGSRIDSVHAGLLGHAGAFSFYPVKHLTTAEGGMLITSDEALADRIALRRAFGVDRVVGERSEPGVYDVTMLGYNYRMNELEAALGCEQIRRADDFLMARERNYQTLAARLGELDEIELLGGSQRAGFTCSRYCLAIVLSDEFGKQRFEVVERLREQGVGSSVYYPKAVPDMAYYLEKYGRTECPQARRISRRSIALPVGPHLDQQDMHYIADAVKQALA